MLAGSGVAALFGLLLVLATFACSKKKQKRQEGSMATPLPVGPSSGQAPETEKAMKTPTPTPGTPATATGEAPLEEKTAEADEPKKTKKDKKRNKKGKKKKAAGDKGNHSGMSVYRIPDTGNTDTNRLKEGVGALLNRRKRSRAEDMELKEEDEDEPGDPGDPNFDDPFEKSRARPREPTKHTAELPTEFASTKLAVPTSTKGPTKTPASQTPPPYTDATNDETLGSHVGRPSPSPNAATPISSEEKAASKKAESRKTAKSRKEAFTGADDKTQKGVSKKSGKSIKTAKSAKKKKPPSSNTATEKDKVSEEEEEERLQAEGQKPPQSNAERTQLMSVKLTKSQKPAASKKSKKSPRKPGLEKTQVRKERRKKLQPEPSAKTSRPRSHRENSLGLNLGP